MACIGHFCLYLIHFYLSGGHIGGQKLVLPPKFSWGGGGGLTAPSAPPPPPRFRRLWGGGGHSSPCPIPSHTPIKSALTIFIFSHLECVIFVSSFLSRHFRHSLTALKGRYSNGLNGSSVIIFCEIRGNFFSSFFLLVIEVGDVQRYPYPVFGKLTNKF